MITKKITYDDVIKVLQEKFSIKDIKFMRTMYSERDTEILDMFEYIEGEITNDNV